VNLQFTNDVVFGIRVSTLLWSALVLALATLAHAALHVWIRRKARREAEAAAEGTADTRRMRRWISRGMLAMLPPLAAILWIQGLRYAIAISLREAGPKTARRTADRARMELRRRHGRGGVLAAAPRRTTHRQVPASLASGGEATRGTT
jgi:hypothetical protein